MTITATREFSATTKSLIESLTPETWDDTIGVIMDSLLDEDDHDGSDAVRWLIDNDVKPFGQPEHTPHFWSISPRDSGTVPLAILSDDKTFYSRRWVGFRQAMGEVSGKKSVCFWLYPDNLTYFVAAWRTGARPF